MSATQERTPDAGATVAAPATLPGDPSRTPRTPRRRGTRIGAEPSRALSTVILLVVAVCFAIPLVAMLEFSLRTGAGTYGLDNWLGLFDPENERRYRVLGEGIVNSLVLAVVTVVLVLGLQLPTMILVKLRFPKLVRVLEFVCLIPLTIPAIVLVVGLAPIYGVIGRTVGSDAWTLAFAYGITVLPYSYRALQSNLAAIDVVTLSEAARSLGASWVTVFGRVLVPNLRRGILVAGLVGTAVVLGEFTIASLLNRTTLQTSLLQISRSDPFTAVAISLLLLVVVSALLVVIGRVGSLQPGRRRRTPRRTS